MSENKFAHLEKYAVKGETLTWFTLHQVAGGPKLQIAPATEANKPFFNALLRRQRKNVRALQSNSITTELLDDSREEDRSLYAKFIVRDWRNVVDSKGKTVPFSHDNALAFLQALPDWLFDDLRQYAGNPANFTEDSTAVDPAEVDELAGNSEGGSATS